MNKILIIEDDMAIIDVLKMIFENDGFITEHAVNGAEGIEKFNSVNPDITLLDIRMPKKDGIEVLQEIKKKDKDAIVVMISGHGNIETAVQTTKLGAYDFISKPIDMERLKLTIQNGLAYKRLLTANLKMKMMLEKDEKLIGQSEQFKKLFSLIKKISSTSSRVLITGENGTGKALVAKEIHRQSSRAEHPFIQTNCSTIPEDSIELELFGCVEGYLDFSPDKRQGKFEQANNGTLYLDEISDLSLNAQSKLLNVLSESRIQPLGSKDFIMADVRIISSTNRDLNMLVSEGNFREDLFHRLNVLNIHVPPLRERKEDIPELVKFFIQKICNENKLGRKILSPEVLTTLSNLKWPGNVRELKNVLERMIILSETDVINASEYLNDHNTYYSEYEKIFSDSTSLHEFQDNSEKVFIEKALTENDWNISKTAESLHIQRSHLYNKIKQFEIEKPQSTK